MDEDFSLLLNCWDKGQESPVHEHGPDTNCWVRVEDGELAIELYDSNDDDSPKDIVSLPTHQCYMITRETGLHKMLNRSKNDRAISFHLYSPPYINCCFKDKSSSTEHMSYLPAVYCSSVEACKGKREDLKKNLQFQQKVFTSLQTFTDILKKELDVNGQNIQYIANIISRFNFNPKEWKKYIHYEQSRYTRNLVGYDDKFTLLLLCWDKGRGSPIHDHAGSSCWVKMLEGELTETRYQLDDEGNVGVKSRTVITPDDVVYIDDTLGLHKMENENPDNIAISLHVYSPPYSNCYSFDLKTGMKKKISLKCVMLQKDQSLIQMQMKKQDNIPRLSEVPDIIGALRSEFSENNPTSSSSCTSTTSSSNSSLNSSPIGSPSISPSSSLSSSPLSSFINSASNSLPMYHSPNVHHIESILNSIVFDPDKWGKFVHFNEHRWTRSLIAFDENFSLVLNCWNKKQGTPVHHHGNDGTCSWMKVLLGEMRTVKYADKKKHKKSSDSISCTSNHTHLEGDDLEGLEIIETSVVDPESPVVYMDGTEGLHRSENASSDQPAISLHLYSPPYLECRAYDQSENFPVVYCNPTQYSCLKGDQGLQYRLQYQEHIYENITSLIDTLKTEFEEDEPCPERIQLIMKSFQLNPREWEQYAASCRTLVGADEKFALELVRRSDSQTTPIHDHGVSRSWMKVLEGEVEETVYVNNQSSRAARCHLKVLESSHWKTDAVVFRDKSTIHRTESIGESVTLYLYSPPCVDCTTYNHVSGEKRKSSVCALLKVR